VYPLPGWGPGWGRFDGGSEEGAPASPGGGRGPEAGLAELLRRLEVVTELLLALQADLRRLAEPAPGAGGAALPAGTALASPPGSPRVPEPPAGPARDPALPGGSAPACRGAPPPLFRQSRDGRWGSVTYRQPAPVPPEGARAWPEPEGPGWAVAGAPPAWFRLSDQQPGCPGFRPRCPESRPGCSWPPPPAENPRS